jgi:denticleless
MNQKGPIGISCETGRRATSGCCHRTGQSVYLGHLEARGFGTRSVRPVRVPEPAFHKLFGLPDPSRIDLDIHENGVFDVQWSPDDTAVATCSGDHTTRITDVATSKTTHILRGHTSTVKTVVWDPQHASLLSTGGRDGGIRVWDLRIAERTSHGMASHAPVIAIDGAHDEDKQVNRGGRRKVAPSARTVTSLLYPEGRSDRLISSGSFDG